MPDPFKSPTCDNDTCTKPTPHDMPGIIAGSNTYCSPACARDATTTSTDPASVQLHDPQFNVDREPLGAPEDVMTLRREPQEDESALDMIRAYGDVYPGEFRR